MLRDDYNIGIVTRGGVKCEGRHEAIVDPAVFEKVQSALQAHRLSGDRTKKHNHYLKGSIYCGHCGQRMIYGRHRGNGGARRWATQPTSKRRRPKKLSMRR
jgi:site-specific DNA recombinase